MNSFKIKVHIVGCLFRFYIGIATWGRARGAATPLVIFGTLSCKRSKYSDRAVSYSNTAYRVVKEVIYGTFMKQNKGNRAKAIYTYCGEDLCFIFSATHMVNYRVQLAALTPSPCNKKITCYAY